MALVPPRASVAADTPLLPKLAEREVLIRFPKHVEYNDRAGTVREVDWVVTFPGYYTPLAPLFRRERKQQRAIRQELAELTESGRYQLVHCRDGAVVLRRQGLDIAPGQIPISDRSSSCPWLQ